MDTTRDSAPPLIKQIWEFLEEQLEISEKREMTLGTFVKSANEVTIAGFWRKHAKGELGTRKTHEIFLEVFVSLLGKEIYGQSVLRGKYHLRGICASLEHIH